MALGLKGADLRAAVAKLRSLLAAGTSDDEACASMGLTWEEYEDLRKALYAQETADLRSKPPEHWFIDYLINQGTNIKDLTAALEDFKTLKAHNARVGAIKARADVYDRIIERGQEFGFIPKAPDRKQVDGLVLVADMAPDDLRKAIAGEMRSIDRLMEIGGEGGILDVDAGPTHRVAPKVKALPSGEEDGDEDAEPMVAIPATPVAASAPGVDTSVKVKPHARGKVHGGRKVVRTKVTA